MTMSVKAEPQKTSGPQECAGCGKKIQDRYYRNLIFKLVAYSMAFSDTYSRHWTCIGMRIASNVDAVTVGWVKWDPLFTPKETCFFANETI